MKLLNMNIPKALLDGDTIAAGLESEEYALPDRSTTLTWQTFFGVNPSVVGFILWGSLDGIVWSSIDTSSVVGGAIRTLNTNVKFIKVELDAITGGSGGVSVLLVAKDL